jgi:hypothetical protein
VCAASSLRGDLRLAAVARLAVGRRFAARRRLALVPRLVAVRRLAVVRRFCRRAALYLPPLFSSRARGRGTFLTLRHISPPESLVSLSSPLKGQSPESQAASEPESGAPCCYASG